jgi:hypothetical protein
LIGQVAAPRQHLQTGLGKTKHAAALGFVCYVATGCVEALLLLLLLLLVGAAGQQAVQVPDLQEIEHLSRALSQIKDAAGDDS